MRVDLQISVVNIIVGQALPDNNNLHLQYHNILRVFNIINFCKYELISAIIQAFTR